MSARYVQRPPVVTAVQWTGDNDAQCREFLGGSPLFFTSLTRSYRQVVRQMATEYVEIGTIGVGDWIVRDQRGRVDTIRNEVFAETYTLEVTP